MARRGQTTSLAERVEIGKRWEAGQKDLEIAAAMSLPVWTVRKWRRKYQKEGRSGLGSRMGRPATGAWGSLLLKCGTPFVTCAGIILAGGRSRFAPNWKTCRTMPV